jgi:type I restriction enzyme M protein
MKFHIVVANPPSRWRSGARNGRRRRSVQALHRGIPPKSKGDYAFILHMIDTALEGEGRVGVIVPHGVLFRGGPKARSAA